VPKPKTSTISRDPYADDPYAFIGKPSNADAAKKAPEPPPQPVAKPDMEKITTPFPVELIERARDAAYWDRTTLAGIIVQALADALDRMEKERGEPYPPRHGELRGGRPVGTGKRK
jgi:hypothetical protein